MRIRVLTVVSCVVALTLSGAGASHASGFLGVLTEQTEPVVVSAPVISLEVGSTTQASVSGGSGSGAYTFNSATPTRCTISSTGLITAVLAGACSVTATKLASGLFLDRTSAALTLTITDPVIPSAAPALSTVTTTAYSVEFNLSSGGASSFTWSGSERVLVRVESKLGARENEFQAGKDKSGVGFIDGLVPGYINKITVADGDGKWIQTRDIAVPPIKVTGISATAATAATNFTYILKWRPQSYFEYYKINVTGPDGKTLSYYTKTSDWALNNKEPGRFLFEILAQGEGESLSEPVRFVATITAPVNISAKLPTNPKSNRLTTASSDQLKSIANRLTPQTEVTVTVYYDAKVKGAKKLAQTRVARAAATLKVTKPTLVVKTQVRKKISTKSLSQIAITTKAPARKLTLTNA